MNSATCGLRVASTAFGLVCLAHLLRILFRVSVVIGGYPFSRKFSAVAVVITGALCLWLWLLSSRPAEAAPEGAQRPSA